MYSLWLYFFNDEYEEVSILSRLVTWLVFYRCLIWVNESAISQKKVVKFCWFKLFLISNFSVPFFHSQVLLGSTLFFGECGSIWFRLRSTFLPKIVTTKFYGIYRIKQWTLNMCILSSIRQQNQKFLQCKVLQNQDLLMI